MLVAEKEAEETQQQVILRTTRNRQLFTISCNRKSIIHLRLALPLELRFFYSLEGIRAGDKNLPRTKPQCQSRAGPLRQSQVGFGRSGAESMQAFESFGYSYDPIFLLWEAQAHLGTQSSEGAFPNAPKMKKFIALELMIMSIIPLLAELMSNGIDIWKTVFSDKKIK